jgi:hypothetical protein
VRLDIIALLALRQRDVPLEHFLQVAQHECLYLCLAAVLGVILQITLVDTVVLGILVPLVRLISSEELLQAALVLLLVYALQGHLGLRRRRRRRVLVQSVQQDNILKQGHHHVHQPLLDIFLIVIVLKRHAQREQLNLLRAEPQRLHKARVLSALLEDILVKSQEQQHVQYALQVHTLKLPAQRV